MSLRFVILFLMPMALVPYAARAVVPYASRAVVPYARMSARALYNASRTAARRLRTQVRFTHGSFRPTPSYMVPILGGSAAVGTGTGLLSEAVDRWGDPGPSSGDPPLDDDSHMISHIGDGLRRSRVGVPDSVADSGRALLIRDPTMRRRRRSRRVVYRRSRRRHR